MTISLSSSRTIFLFGLLAVCHTWQQVASFVLSPSSVRGPFGRNYALCMSTSSTSSVPTLTDQTTWQLRFVLRGLPTAKGKKVDQIFNIQAQFIEEEGFEPPQGYVKQLTMATTGEEDDEEKDSGNNNKSQLQIVNSRWLLSEDPEDRKDGLWVWGLFKEPLYPFMLLQLTTESIPLPGEEEDSIEPLALFAQINHKRDKDDGSVTLSRAELKIREVETVKADLLGVSTAEIYEEKTIGQCVFQPLVDGKPVSS